MHAVICPAREHIQPPALLPFHIPIPSPQSRIAPPSHPTKARCSQHTPTTHPTHTTHLHQQVHIHECEMMQPQQANCSLLTTTRRSQRPSSNLFASVRCVLQTAINHIMCSPIHYRRHLHLLPIASCVCKTPSEYTHTHTHTQSVCDKRPMMCYIESALSIMCALYKVSSRESVLNRTHYP